MEVPLRSCRRRHRPGAGPGAGEPLADRVHPRPRSGSSSLSGSARRRSPTGSPSCRCGEARSRSRSARPASSPRSGPIATSRPLGGGPKPRPTLRPGSRPAGRSWTQPRTRRSRPRRRSAGGRSPQVCPSRTEVDSARRSGRRGETPTAGRTGATRATSARDYPRRPTSKTGHFRQNLVVRRGKSPEQILSLPPRLRT